jgi:Putative transposase DNA-binding domain
LRSIRDTNFDIARMKLANFMSIHANTPEWLKEAAKTLDQWKSPARLAALALRWCKEEEIEVTTEKVTVNGSIRIAVKETKYVGKAKHDAAIDSAFRELEEWRIHDHHLWQWESSQRTKSLRNRREIYRIFASELSKRYETLVLENFDLRDIAKRQSVDDTSSDNKTARSNRQLAAVGDLRLHLINAFLGRGGKVEKVPSENTTITCNVCGLVEKFDAATHLHHTCSGCGTFADQDVQAWKNMLTIWREQKRDAKVPDTARNPEKEESRWIKARRMAAEKKARKDTAREVVDNDA